MKKNVPVYSIKKMMELVRAGYNVVCVVDNNINPKLKVFFFEDEEGIEKYL